MKVGKEKHSVWNYSRAGDHE